jgi:hypothetical protein
LNQREYALKGNTLFIINNNNNNNNNELLGTLFSNILSPCSSLNAKHQDPYITACKFLALYVLIFIPIDSRQIKKRF